MEDNLQYTVAPAGGALISDSRETCEPLSAVGVRRLGVPELIVTKIY